jgi:hypothetical protein
LIRFERILFLLILRSKINKTVFVQNIIWKRKLHTGAKAAVSQVLWRRRRQNAYETASFKKFGSAAKDV